MLYTEYALTIVSDYRLSIDENGGQKNFGKTMVTRTQSARLSALSLFLIGTERE